MIATVRQALARLARDGTMTLAALVTEVAGPVKGSWWGHPKGKTIFRIASELEDSPDVLATRLIEGKVTFVHRALWPALLRVVTDPGWRAGATRGLSPAARGLLARAERAGRLRLAASDRKPRAELERRGLVLSSSEHTERGSHAAVLRSWADFAPPDETRAAAALSLEEARARLAAAGLFSP